MTRMRTLWRAIIGITIIVNVIAAYSWWTTGTYSFVLGYMLVGIGAHMGLLVAYVRWAREAKKQGE